MKHSIRTFAAGLAGSVLLSGCASRTPETDVHLGSTVRGVMLQQVANPNAGRDDPAFGLDGKAAHEAHVKYVDSFKAPPPPSTVFSFGISGGGGR